MKRLVRMPYWTSNRSRLIFHSLVLLTNTRLHHEKERKKRELLWNGRFVKFHRVVVKHNVFPCIFLQNNFIPFIPFLLGNFIKWNVPRTLNYSRDSCQNRYFINYWAILSYRADRYTCTCVQDKMLLRSFRKERFEFLSL